MSNFNENNTKNYKGKNNKKNKQEKINPNEIKVVLNMSANLDENIANEIIDVLYTTKFNKISLPLNVYRSLIDSNAELDDNRVCTIGYIRDFNPETHVFTVVVFKNYVEIFKNMNIVMDLIFTTYNNSLGAITKFIIKPAEIKNHECCNCESV